MPVLTGCDKFQTEALSALSGKLRKGDAPIMKRMLSIAMGIGFLISTIFMAMPSMRDGTSEWADLELPGMGAAYVFWGAVGDPVIVGTAIGWAVNAVVYGLVALVIIGALKIISAAVRKISN
jgi:hypothetical protein